MIPRTGRKLEAILASFSHARHYSSATKPTEAPASGLASASASVPHPDYPTFLQPQKRPGDEESPLSGSMQGFLRRRVPYTLLPTPLPDGNSSAINDFYFTDSPTQDSLAIIDACLHNLYDVPRARQVFERMRSTKSGCLHIGVYNSFLEAYVEMATTKEPNDRGVWIEMAKDLFQAMERRKEVPPNATTYALMLLVWRRFNSKSSTPITNVELDDVTTLLSNIIDREIDITHVVSSRVFTSSDEVADIIKLLSKEAVKMNMRGVVNTLGQAEAIGTQLYDPLDDVPQVKPVERIKGRVNPPASETDQANESVTASNPNVPFNLENLRMHLAQVALARRVLPEDVTSRQKLLEASVFDVAVARMKNQVKTLESLGMGNIGLGRGDLQVWMWNWHTKLTDKLGSTIGDLIKAEADIAMLSSGKWGAKKDKGIILAPFLSLVKPEKLSLLTIHEIMRLQGTGGVTHGMKTARALLHVGRAVETEYKAEMCKKNNIQIPSQPRAGEQGYFSRFGYRDLHARRVAARKYTQDAEEWTANWSQLLRVRVGSILVDSLMGVSTVVRTATDKQTGELVTEEQPAFFHTYEYLRGHKLGVIKLNPVVAEKLANDITPTALSPRHLPMLIKPKPWLAHDNGGYLFSKTSAMRFKDSNEQLSYLRNADELGAIELVYAGLDVLGSTPWKINRKVFDVVLTVWNSGQRMPKIPPAEYEVPEPEKTENIDTDLQARSVYLQKMRVYHQEKANNHSDRCNVNYKIEIARAFLGDTIYLPHNLDFRGRAYPIPPHLNHIGDDLSRGLLMFAEEKPLGESGLRWIKIHLANLYGFDKGSFDERVDFVMEHLEDIYDSAEKPLEGRRWWTTADDPWQCLATCMELRAALESPDPTEYLSSLPVHQDGTCNGLQHYAALGGDDKGARQVNLGVTDRPSDVYTFVADMVEKIVADDVKKGDKYAILLQGKISRKVVKQTVMTTVYGVTFVGAREQIEKQLRERRDIPPEECWATSSYLARKVLGCIGELFKGAKGIQSWLNICARLISKSIPTERLPESMMDHRKGRSKKPTAHATRLRKEQMTSVVWSTPLGLPIVQPYRRTNRKQVMTALQTVYISDPNSHAEVNSQKQASAFPPNFIHSLDATHMMMTALQCREEHLTFASVHDSYWTHACSIDQMSKIIRNTFIALHSSEILKRLEEEFRDRYKDFKVPLLNLRTGTLLKKLRDAGTRISVFPEQATNVRALDKILTTSKEKKTSIDDIGSVLTDATPIKRGGSNKSTEPPEEQDDEAEEVTEPDAALLGKFVDVVDLLPPLPTKGTFDVENIQWSKYFFS